MSRIPNLTICPWDANVRFVDQIIREPSRSLTVPTLSSEIVITQLCAGSLLTSGRLEDADFTLLDAVVQRTHKLQLNVIRLVRMIELLGTLHVYCTQVSSSQSDSDRYCCGADAPRSISIVYGKWGLESALNENSLDTKQTHPCEDVRYALDMSLSTSRDTIIVQQDDDYDCKYFIL